MKPSELDVKTYAKSRTNGVASHRTALKDRAPQCTIADKISRSRPDANQNITQAPLFKRSWNLRLAFKSFGLILINSLIEFVAEE